MLWLTGSSRGFERVDNAAAFFPTLRVVDVARRRPLSVRLDVAAGCRPLDRSPLLRTSLVPASGKEKERNKNRRQIPHRVRARHVDLIAVRDLKFPK